MAKRKDEMTVTVDISEEAGEAIESCEHEWKRIKVIDPAGNHFVYVCLRCGEEKPY